MYMLPLYLHVNNKSDDDDDEYGVFSRVVKEGQSLFPLFLQCGGQKIQMTGAKLLNQHLTLSYF